MSDPCRCCCAILTPAVAEAFCEHEGRNIMDLAMECYADGWHLKGFQFGERDMPSIGVGEKDRLPDEEIVRRLRGRNDRLSDLAADAITRLRMGIAETIHTTQGEHG